MPATPADGTVSVLILRALLLGADGHGIDRGELCRATGLLLEAIAPAVLGDPDARVPARAVLSLWHELPRLTGNETFGLWLAERVGAAPISPAGWFIQSSPTLREGLRRVVRFQRLLHDHARGELVERDDEVSYVHQIGDRAFRAPRHAIEFGFAQSVLLVRRCLGENVFPKRVEFQHAQPPDVTGHLGWFGEGIRFGAERDALSFDHTLTDRPLPTRDDALGELILSHARGLLERLPSDASFSARVRRAVVEALPQEVLELGGVATRLSLKKRTLQRRLADEGTSFDEILDAVRRELAERYFVDQGLGAQECAFLLGYSDLSAFHRAFQRWHGVAPAHFRLRLVKG
jgi:AraC-like DNA-binding protein